MVVALLALLAAGVWLAWMRANQWMRGRPEFVVTAESLELSPVPPPWIGSDLRADVLQEAARQGPLSVLDPPAALQQRLADALRFHPWVRSVERITKAPPNRLVVELTYRTPVAAVRWDGDPQTLLLVDDQAVRLPEGDVAEEARRTLPRIAIDGHKPLVGQRWEDSRLLGALALVSGLGEYWRQASIVEIVSHPQPEIRGTGRWPIFALLTSGATRIEWGAAPGQGPIDEPRFEEKLGRLMRYVAENGPLDSIRAPEVLDIRYSTTASPRTVQRNTNAGPGVK